jgi:hypothetical protein
VARRALPSVLSPPGTVDIKVTNENNAALGVDAIVTDVDFSIEEKRHAVRGGRRAHQAGLSFRCSVQNLVDFVTRIFYK